MWEWLRIWGYVAACVIVPIVWGWLVNLAFNRWRRSTVNAALRARQDACNGHEADEEEAFIDYQI